MRCGSSYGLCFCFFPSSSSIEKFGMWNGRDEHHMEWMNELAIKWLMYTIHRSRYQMYWKLHRPFGLPKHTNSIWMRFNNVWKIIIFVIVCETNSIKNNRRLFWTNQSKERGKFHHFERKIDVYRQTTISIWAYEYLCRFSIFRKHNFRRGRYFADTVCQIS